MVTGWEFLEETGKRSNGIGGLDLIRRRINIEEIYSYMQMSYILIYIHIFVQIYICCGSLAGFPTSDQGRVSQHFPTINVLFCMTGCRGDLSMYDFIRECSPSPTLFFELYEQIAMKWESDFTKPGFQLTHHQTIVVGRCFWWS